MHLTPARNPGARLDLNEQRLSDEPGDSPRELDSIRAVDLFDNRTDDLLV